MNKSPLYDLLKQANVSIADLTEAFGVCRTTVWKWSKAPPKGVVSYLKLMVRFKALGKYLESLKT